MRDEQSKEYKSKTEELESKLKRAKSIESSIWSYTHNIESYNKVFNGAEIAIKCNADCNEHNTPTVYFSGKIKDAIKKLLIDEATKQITESKLELDEL